MVPNPFIALARDPIATLSAVGYLLLLVATLVVAVPWSVRALAEVVEDYRQNAHRQGSDKWVRLWGEGRGYLPNGSVAFKLFMALFVLFGATQAAAALLWFAGITGVGT